MLAKLTTKNQITIPKTVLKQIPESSHFDVTVQDGRIILKPAHFSDESLANVRQKIEALGLTEEAEDEAVQWARSR